MSSYYFSETFIEYSYYSLIAGSIGPPSLSSILGKQICEEIFDLSFHLLFFKSSKSEQMSLDFILLSFLE